MFKFFDVLVFIHTLKNSDRKAGIKTLDDNRLNSNYNYNK